MRVVHLTDLHVQRPPEAADLWGKRLIGSANLYLFGRRSHFTVAAQEAAVRAAVEAEPDVVVITGDLTAQALDTEFLAARELLAPITENIPTVIIPGNHDTYVREPSPGHRMRAHFGDWMGDGAPSLRRCGPLAFLHIETCRAALRSNGHCDPAQLPRATALLRTVPDCFVFLLLHYPLRDRHGNAYGPPMRALSNAAQVEAWIRDQGCIGAILHGHEHHGFQAELNGIPILNPGASGYAHLPGKKRTAHLNIYEADQEGIHEIRRLRFDGAAFTEEPGGAYASGR
jgi:3',5'-cyclic AMP phosphodiesterase CpdA